MSLSKTEEQLMQHLWKAKRALMKELRDAHEHPKPATTTLATLLKRMQEKGYVDYEQKGRSREYFPLVSKKAYFGSHVRSLIKTFFNNDTTQFASFFTESTEMSQEELIELRSLIDEQIERK